MNAYGWKAIIHQYLVEVNRSVDALDENDHLIEMQGVKQISELPILLLLLQLGVELLQTMQVEFSLIVNKDFEWLYHCFTFSFMNFLQIGLTDGGRVAENIITCLVFGVLRKMSCTDSLMSEVSKLKTCLF